MLNLISALYVDPRGRKRGLLRARENEELCARSRAAEIKRGREKRRAFVRGAKIEPRRRLPGTRRGPASDVALPGSGGH